MRRPGPTWPTPVAALARGARPRRRPSTPGCRRSWRPQGAAPTAVTCSHVVPTPTWVGVAVAASANEPCAVAPYWSWPQHHSVPSVRVAHVVYRPAATRLHVVAGADLAGREDVAGRRLAGLELPVGAPAPQRAVGARRAHVPDTPVATCDHDPAIWWGGDAVVYVPSPSWPLQFAPQHHSVASVRMAQVWPYVVDTNAHVVAVPTLVGVQRWVVVPSPSWPTLFSPQHHSVPSVLMPHVWLSPELSCAHEPVTWTGWLRSTVVPSPTPPAQFVPQHQPESSVRAAHEP